MGRRDKIVTKCLEYRILFENIAQILKLSWRFFVSPSVSRRPLLFSPTKDHKNHFRGVTCALGGRLDYICNPKTYRSVIPAICTARRGVKQENDWKPELIPDRAYPAVTSANFQKLVPGNDFLDPL